MNQFSDTIFRNFQLQLNSIGMRFIFSCVYLYILNKTKFIRFHPNLIQYRVLFRSMFKKTIFFRWC